MSTAKRLRRPPEGGYARGDETRHRIIEAAVELFGEHGFAGASTRDIAARAGVNAPALQYYFENKEGVYKACVESLADDAWEAFRPAIEHAREVVSKNGSTEEMIAAFIRIQESAADAAFAKAANTSRRLFFAREQSGQEPDAASQILFTRVRKPLTDACAALVARITGRAADDPVTLIRTFSLHGQLVIFHVAHRSSLSILGWKSIDASRIQEIKSVIREQTRTLLETWSRERDVAQAAAQAVTETAALATKTASTEDAVQTTGTTSKSKVSR
jgi:TetR/AcrR family transcriptional regulator, regulator of cefoperazone and chloramphenicol sensitivity